MSASARAPRIVHVVSHGPHCLDGVAAAAAIAHYRKGAEIRPRFAGNPQIDETILALEPEGSLEDQELWITDISWTAPEADRHLRELAERGLAIYWIDHHRTAIDRVAKGKIDVPFTHRIVDDRYAASRLVYEYLAERIAAEGDANPAFERFAPVVALADDNDRWIHEIPGSWDLALTLRSLNGPEALEELMQLDERLEYTPKLRAAQAKIKTEMRRSFALAERTRRERALENGVRIVAAVCDGYPSEIADRWGKATPNAVFVLFDFKGAAVSYRRSPDCKVDLSRVAEAFGGGGHPAAAGCEMPDLLVALASGALEKVASVVADLPSNRE